jgi:hypothetical protein
LKELFCLCGDQAEVSAPLLIENILDSLYNIKFNKNVVKWFEIFKEDYFNCA